MNTLSTAIANWDQYSTDDIQQVYATFSKHPEFVTDLLMLLSSNRHQVGASWLLKRHCKCGHALLQQQQQALVECFANQSEWQAMLHILQLLPHFEIEPNQLRDTELFVRRSLQSNNKFVRAWAYNGFYQIAKQYPDYRQECTELINMAMQDEAASVKSRIRNILKDKGAGF